MTETKDPYRTRTEKVLEPVSRQDPVVHRGPARPTDGPLDEQGLSAFEEEGYLLLEDIFTADEVRQLGDEMERLIGNEIVRQSEISVTDPTSGEIRTIYAAHTVSEVITRLARDPRLLGVAQQILGGEVYLHQSRVNLKPGFYGKENSWHSDFETWHAKDGMPRMRAVSFSVSITDNRMFNGSMMVIPGSHKTFIACTDKGPEGHQRVSLKSQQYGVPSREIISELAERHGIEAPVGPAGSVVVYDCNLLHGSNSNITPFPRANAFFVYNSVENTLEMPFATEDERPWYFANREFDALTPRPFSKS